MHMTGDPSTISLWHSWSEKAQCGMRRSMLVLPLLVCACCSVLRRCYVKRGVGPWNGFMDLGKWCSVTVPISFGPDWEFRPTRKDAAAAIDIRRGRARAQTRARTRIGRDQEGQGSHARSNIDRIISRIAIRRNFLIDVDS